MCTEFLRYSGIQDVVQEASGLKKILFPKYIDWLEDILSQKQIQCAWIMLCDQKSHSRFMHYNFVFLGRIMEQWTEMGKREVDK